MATYVTAVNNLSNLPNLGAINFAANRLTSLDLTGCTNLDSLNVYGSQLTSLDLSNCPLLSSINIGSNADLASLTLPTLSFCIYVNAAFCSLSTTIVNNFFINLANQGTTGGNAFFNGGNNGIPDGAGLSAALYLQGDAGWNISYNT